MKYTQQKNKKNKKKQKQKQQKKQEEEGTETKTNKKHEKEETDEISSANVPHYGQLDVTSFCIKPFLLKLTFEGSKSFNLSVNKQLIVND